MILATLVTFAGCSGVPSGDGSAPNRDTYSVDDQVESSIAAEGAGSESFPMGLTDDGIENFAIFFQRHQDSIRNTSYTAEIRRVVVDGNQTQRLEQEIRIHPEHGRYVRERVTGSGVVGGERTVEQWSDGTVTVTRYETGDGTVTYNDRTPHTSVGNFVGIVRSLAQANETTVERVDTDVAGYVVEARDDNPAANEYDTAHAWLFVDDDDVIRTAYRFWRVSDDDDRSRLEAFTYSDVGETTVERPDWYHEALDASNESFDE